jgi:hypothetical protein
MKPVKTKDSFSKELGTFTLMPLFGGMEMALTFQIPLRDREELAT